MRMAAIRSRRRLPYKGTTVRYQSLPHPIPPYDGGSRGRRVSGASYNRGKEPDRMGIVRFALRFPHTFYVVAALILFLGGVASYTMRTDIFPEIRIPVVTVIWQYTGLSTPEMEQRVTTYSQYSISSNVNGIKDIEAQTMA